MYVDRAPIGGNNRIPANPFAAADTYCATGRVVANLTGKGTREEIVRQFRKGKMGGLL